MDGGLRGKTAIVTGAGTGIGAAAARMLAREGASVMITGRREELLRSLKSEIEAFGGVCRFLSGDMADDDFLERLVDEASGEFGHVDILVCSAGMALRAPTMDMRKEQWDQVMRVNLWAPVRLSQICIGRFKCQGTGGKIVYVSSTAGKNINLGASPSYGASKAGLLYMVRHLAREFAADGIYVNAVCPGPVDTEITATWTPEHRKRVLADLPLGRLGTPEEIAHMIVFLASPLSDYITGESVLINGGRFME